LHANARSLCCFLEREGLFDRQLQRAGGREMHEVADRAGNFGSAGPAAELGGPKSLDGRLFKNEIAWVYDHRLVGHSAEGHELAAFGKHVQQLSAFLSAD
jgi:acetyltransferase-like isoleucine patch superfamily enzyme